jgi:hypothetical protein
MALEDRPTYLNVSNDRRAWDEVCPDQWWAADHLLGKEVPVLITAVEMEQYPDSPPKPFLKFANDPKWFRLSRDARQVLKDLFGQSPSDCLGKWITITAGPNSMKTIVTKILPRQTNPPASAQQPAAPAMTPEQMAQFAAWQASQGK